MQSYHFQAPFLFSASTKPNHVPVVFDITFHLSNGICLWKANILSESACEPNWVKYLENRLLIVFLFFFFMDDLAQGMDSFWARFITGRIFSFISHSNLFYCNEYDDWTSNHFYLISELISRTCIYSLLKLIFTVLSPLFTFKKHLKIIISGQLVKKSSDWLIPLNPSTN